MSENRTEAIANGPPPTLRFLWTLGRRSIGFSLGGLAYKAIALISVPVLARLLTPSELGLLDLAAMLATLTGIVIGLGTDNAVTRLQVDADEEPSVWGAATILISAAGLVTLIFAVVFQRPLALLLTGSATRGDLMFVALVYGVGVAGVTYALNAVRLRSTARRYALLSFALVTAEMIGAIACALVLDGPVVPIIWAWAIISLLGAALIARANIGALARPSRLLMRRMVRFGLPLVPAVAAWVIGDLGIRAAIAHSGDLALLGEYGIAFRIASVMALVISGFALAWQPLIYRTTKAEVARVATQAGLALLVVLSALGVMLAFAAPTIAAVVAGPAYVGAAAAVPALAAGMVAFGIFTVLAAVEGVRYRTLPIAVASVLGMAVQILVAPALVGGSGVAGAGIASFVGYAVGAAALGIDFALLQRRL